MSRAPPKVRALFAAAQQWERALGGLQVDGGPCCGALAEIVVHYCRAGMRKHSKPKPGQSGYDCRDAQGRRVQIKAIGHGKPWFQFTIDPSQAERLIVLRIYDASWDVIYDGPTKPIRGGSAKLRDPNKIVVLKTELSQLAKPHTWERFWHVSGTSKA